MISDSRGHRPPVRQPDGACRNRRAGWYGAALSAALGLHLIACPAAVPAGEPPLPSARAVPETLPPPAALRPTVAPVTAASATPPSAPVTITDVVAMHQSGLDDQVIINVIRQNGMAGGLSTSELISLRRHGVSNTVISAMQASAPPPARTVIAEPPPSVVHVYEPPPPPVIIRTWSPPPCWYYPRPHYHAGIHFHSQGRGKKDRGPSVGFGISWR